MTLVSSPLDDLCIDISISAMIICLSILIPERQGTAMHYIVDKEDRMVDKGDSMVDKEDGVVDKEDGMMHGEVVMVDKKSGMVYKDGWIQS